MTLSGLLEGPLAGSLIEEVERQMLNLSGIDTSEGSATFMPDEETSFIEQGISVPHGSRIIEIQFTLVRSEARFWTSGMVGAQ